MAYLAVYLSAATSTVELVDWDDRRTYHADYCEVPSERLAGLPGRNCETSGLFLVLFRSTPQCPSVRPQIFPISTKLSRSRKSVSAKMADFKSSISSVGMHVTKKVMANCTGYT